MTQVKIDVTIKMLMLDHHGYQGRYLANGRDISPYSHHSPLVAPVRLDLEESARLFAEGSVEWELSFSPHITAAEGIYFVDSPLTSASLSPSSPVNSSEDTSDEHENSFSEEDSDSEESDLDNEPERQQCNAPKTTLTNSRQGFASYAPSILQYSKGLRTRFDESKNHWKRHNLNLETNLQDQYQSQIPAQNEQEATTEPQTDPQTVDIQSDSEQDEQDQSDQESQDEPELDTHPGCDRRPGKRQRSTWSSVNSDSEASPVINKRRLVRSRSHTARSRAGEASKTAHKKRRKKTVHQVRILRAQFVFDPRPNKACLLALVDQCQGLTQKEITRWFRNERHKIKKGRESRDE